MKLTRPIMRYHGGKWMLADWIISHFPKHRTYVEPFGGAASVLAKKTPSYSEVYNDLSDEIVNVFRILRDPEKSSELVRLCYLTPFSRTEFSESYEMTGTDVERARKTVFRSFAGFGSASANTKYKTGFRANSNRSNTTPAHDWKNFPPAVKSFAERFRGVIVENRPAEKVILQHDSEETLFYLDPPYVFDTRKSVGAYSYEMTNEEHKSLSETLNSLSGMVVLSGYDSDLYRELYPGWEIVTRKAYADGRSERTEVLWLNHAAKEKKSQLTIYSMVESDS